MNQKVSDDDPIKTNPTRSYEEYNKSGMNFLIETFKNPKILKSKNVYKKALKSLKNK